MANPRWVINSIKRGEMRVSNPHKMLWQKNWDYRNWIFVLLLGLFKVAFFLFEWGLNSFELRIKQKDIFVQSKWMKRECKWVNNNNKKKVDNKQICWRNYLLTQRPNKSSDLKVGFCHVDLHEDNK
jgi:hypothetical protein